MGGLNVMDNAREVAAIIRPDYPEPLWIQAATLIREQIDGGVLKAGARLPPERELCQELRISRVTLRKALGNLVDAGVLNASHGRGWFVAKTVSKREWPNTLESFSETAARMGLEPQSEVLRAQIAPASFDEAEELSIVPGTDLFHLDRVRLLDGVPIALDLTQIAASVLPSAAETDFSTRSFYSTLAGAGIEPVRADSTIEARDSTDEESQHLRIAENKPLLVMHQVSFDRNERPIFTSTIKYVGARYRLRTSFSRPQAG
ncbi:MAG TPA: GntR family transcriptional regulator [Trebonia sp.]